MAENRCGIFGYMVRTGYPWKPPREEWGAELDPFPKHGSLRLCQASLISKSLRGEEEGIVLIKPRRGDGQEDNGNKTSFRSSIVSSREEMPVESSTNVLPSRNLISKMLWGLLQIYTGTAHTHPEMGQFPAAVMPTPKDTIPVSCSTVK